MSVGVGLSQLGRSAVGRDKLTLLIITAVFGALNHLKVSGVVDRIEEGMRGIKVE